MRTKSMWTVGVIVSILMLYVAVSIGYAQTQPDLSVWDGKTFNILIITKGYCQTVGESTRIRSSDVRKGSLLLTWDDGNAVLQATLEYITDNASKVVEFPLYYIVGTLEDFLAWGFGGNDDPTIGFTAQVRGILGVEGMRPLSFGTLGGFSFDIVGSEYCAHELEIPGKPVDRGRK